ncbi:MAG: homoserine dehydrogenase [Phycisphaera sp.]|nr:homoserine dehydrogenase [Phycisphaera sp.]
MGIGLIGCGTVGGGVAALLRDEADLYAGRLGQPVAIRRVLTRSGKACSDDRGPLFDTSQVTRDFDAFLATPDMPIVVEVAGGIDPVGGYVERAIKAGKHVVTANKSLLAARGPALFALARKHNVSIAFEASCAGGIPIITALQFGLMANRCEGLFAILNGTCNFILTQMTQLGESYTDALKEAQRLGYAEADPTLDVSGADAAQKLAILASLAFGVRVSGDAVACHGIDQLQLEDIRFGAELGYDVKLLAISERWPGEVGLSCNVMPCFISRKELLGQVHGAYNALVVRGHAVGQTMFYGRGAGRFPTASAVVSDILNVASGGYPIAFSHMHLTSDQAPHAQVIALDDLWSRFYIRIGALDIPGVMAKVTTILGHHGISLSAVLQHETNAGQVVPVVITTHEARLGDLIKALGEVEALDVIHGKPVWLRIVDLPDD